MAALANREIYSAMGKGLGGCFAMGTCFCMLDTVRNPSPGNFLSVCTFGLASWALLAGAVRVKQSSFGASAPVSETIVGWQFGAPSWIRAGVWIGLFLVLLALAAVMVGHQTELHLPAQGVKLVFAAAFGAYLLGCRRLETFVRARLRHRYPDKPQVAISASGLWITGTEIPWGCIQAITRSKRSVKLVNVDTIVVRAQSGRSPENIECDLSDSVEDPQGLCAKLQSAAAAHGAPLQPQGRELRPATRSRLQENRERLREAREKVEQWRATLPQEIAKTEVQIEAVKSRIAQSETRIAELEVALAQNDRPSEQAQKNLELTRASLQANLRVHDSYEKLLETQRNAYEKRR
jgi:hypothetical protein